MRASLTIVALVASVTVVRAAQELPDISGEVVRAVRDCSSLTMFDDVDAWVEGDVVQLAGNVTSSSKRVELQSRMARIAGVREVRNELHVLPASASDDELRRRAARAIYGHPSFWSYAALPNPPIHIIVESGRVTLKGTVNTPAERSLARSLVSGLGETSVVNALKTERSR